MGRPKNVPASPPVRGITVRFLRVWVLRLSAEDFAPLAGVSPRTLLAWEREEKGTRPTEAQARALARALNVSRRTLSSDPVLR